MREEAPGRTREQLRNHYLVEKELADRLRKSSRTERAQLFRTLYDELFQRVPDHPRLVRRESAESSARSVEARMALLRDRLGPDLTFLEFAPGDCRLAFEVAKAVKSVIAVDISDQSGEAPQVPSNFRLLVYDGYQLDWPRDSVDVMFSYQFIEHLHPDDTQTHFELAYRLLKPGGTYIFSTPHRYSGPHDVSAHFSDTPEGFHLKEWTYHEMFDLLQKVGFSRAFTYRRRRAMTSRTVNFLTTSLERALDRLPVPLRKKLSRRVFQSVTMIAFK
jgi:SAM-dependent methyltransferase